MSTRGVEAPEGLLPLPVVLRPAVAEAQRRLREYAQAVDAALTCLVDQTSREEVQSTWLEALADLGAASEGLRKSLNRVSAAAGLPRGGKGRILALFQFQLGHPLSGKQLGAVAGIGEWARRVRELRAEGYDIGSDETRSDLKPGEYVLVSEAPDTRLRDQWNRADAIRRLNIPPKEKLTLFFREHAGQKLTEEQLRHVTRARNLPNLLRDAREAGLLINSYLEDPGLARGQYRLVATP
jgi:hypothetical protein